MNASIQHAIDRVAKLIADGQAVIATTPKAATTRQRPVRGSIEAGFVQVSKQTTPRVDPARYAGWRARAEATLIDIFGEKHAYTRAFTGIGNSTATTSVVQQVGVLQGVADAIAGGELLAFASDVVSDVFADMLEMAEHMFTTPGYHPAAAAMLCGAVLENTLKRLCDAKGIPRNRDGIDTLNTKLHAAGVYNAFTRDSVTAWRRPRNDADHGDFDQVHANDVRSMLDGVRKFVAEHASALGGQS